MTIVGFAYAFAAAVSFGVQYVPVKKYEIFDGTTFQWFMCNGILMVACLMSIATGDITRGISLLCMCGGALWALSNYIVIPLVKLLGIGLGFSLYHFVNLVVGYTVGRFGLFGLPRLKPKAEQGLLVCDFGCLLLLIGFVIMVFVETGPGTHDLEDRPLPPPVVEGVEDDEELQEYRQRYRQWRIGEAKGARDRVGTFLVQTVGVKQRGPVRFVQFGLYADPRVASEEPPVVEKPTLAQPLLGSDACPRSNSEPTGLSEWILESQEVGGVGALPNGSVNSAVGASWGAAGRKVLGVTLAIFGGTLCGVNNVPPSLFTLQHPELGPFSSVFSQCLGVWMVSSLIYLVYSSLARLAKWPVPHSAIRPAYISGCIWAIGFACMLAGIRDLGYSIGYTLDAVGPVVVSSLISIFVYKEITGSRQLAFFALSFVCQLTGVSLIAVFGRA